jgi:hypothetical protein
MRDYTLSRWAINLQILSHTLFEKTPDYRRRTQTVRCNGYAGSRLNRSNEREGAARKASIEAVLGKTRRTEF